MYSHPKLVKRDQQNPAEDLGLGPQLLPQAFRVKASRFSKDQLMELCNLLLEVVFLAGLILILYVVSVLAGAPC